MWPSPNFQLSFKRIRIFASVISIFVSKTLHQWKIRIGTSFLFSELAPPSVGGLLRFFTQNPGVSFGIFIWHARYEPYRITGISYSRTRWVETNVYTQLVMVRSGRRLAR